LAGGGMGGNTPPMPIAGYATDLKRRGGIQQFVKIR